MTNKELRRMGRKELLEMLIAQVEENEKLHLEVDRLKRELQDKHITIENAGSMADAALQLNGVFEAAQKAADQYMENLHQMEEQKEMLAQEMEKDAKKRAESIIEEANVYSNRIREEANQYLEKVEEFLKESDKMQQLIRRGREGV